MTQTLMIPLVGSHFRPPASLVLGVLPAGTELQLTPEPTNPYDPLAVQVWVRPELIPESQQASLGESLPGAGFELDELLALSGLHLGYLCSSSNQRQLAKAPEGEVWSSNASVEGLEGLEGSLVFSSTGQPLVRVELPGAG